MSREALVALLLRLVADGKLTEADAAALVARYDAGELPSVGAPSSPTPPQPGARDFGGATPDAMDARFEAQVARLAALVATGQAGIADWQARMAQLVADEMMSLATLGADGELTAEDIAEIDAEAEAQAAYLSRFADEMALGLLTGQPMSEAAIRARSELYGGVGWDWYYRAHERHLGDERGIVVDYVAQDDERTCQPCLNAEAGSPYLPGKGPFPGDVCAGGGRCRCRREEYYDMEAWRRLTGA